MKTYKLMFIGALAAVGAVLSQVDEADAKCKTANNLPFHNGAGGLVCCKGEQTTQAQACGVMQANIDGGPGCIISGSGGRRLSISLMNGGSAEARITCTGGGSGSLSDFTPDLRAENRCDIGRGCSAASFFQVQAL